MILKFGHHGLQAFLKITAIARTGQQCAHIEGIDRCVCQNFRHLGFDDLARQTFGDRSFTDTGIPHQKRVVLAAAAQHLNATLNLVIATDQRVNIAFLRFYVQIDAIFRQCAFVLTGFFRRISVVVQCWCARDRAAFAKCRIFRDTMGDEIHRVIARHVLVL